MPRGLVLVSGIALCTAFALRFRFLDLPLERDEGVYAVIAQQVLAGSPLYESAHDMRFPGIYVVYALAILVFGATQTGIHAALLFANACSCALLYGLTRSLGGPSIGLAAAATFAVTSLGPGVQGLWANNEHFVLPLALGGVWLLRSASPRNLRPRLFAAGLLLGAAPLVKQHGVFFPVFALSTVLAGAIHRSTRPEALRNLLVLAAGIAGSLAIAAGALWYASVLDDFWFWAIRYASQYAGRVRPERGLDYLVSNGSGLLRAAWPVLALSVIGLGVLARGGRWQAQRGFMLGFVATSVLCVVPGLYFRPHYFVFLLPAAGLTAAFGIDALARGAARLSPKAPSWVAAGVLALALGSTLWADRIFYSLPLRAAMHAVYFPNPFPEARAVGAYIREHTEPDEAIAVIGSEPEIYFYSARRPATSWVYTYPMMEPHPLALSMQQEMIAEIEAARPAFLVFVGTQYSWLVRPGSPLDILDWAKEYTSRHYLRVGVVDMISPRKSVMLWGDEAARYEARSKNFLWIFERRDRLIGEAGSETP